MVAHIIGLVFETVDKVMHEEIRDEGDRQARKRADQKAFAGFFQYASIAKTPEKKAVKNRTPFQL
jgi:hypothetical protein